jgi:hypothetical protein
MMQLTNMIRTDGIGSYIHTLICTVLMAENLGHEFVYTPITGKFNHNYENDPCYEQKLEEFVNFKTNYKTINDVNSKPIPVLLRTCLDFFENNIDSWLASPSMKNIQRIFHENKTKSVFNTNFCNVAVHVRRKNRCDERITGTNIPDQKYLDAMNDIRKTGNNHLFHIYSQGSIENFSVFQADDVIFHLNEFVTKVFYEMVVADKLVMSNSGFSYGAAILSNNEIHYQPYWHPPASRWIRRPGPAMQFSNY